MQLMKNKCPMTKVNHLEQACFKGSVLRDLLPFFMIQTHLEYLTIWHRYSNQTLRCASYLRVKLCGVMHTTESALSNFLIEYLVELETKFENT